MTETKLRPASLEKLLGRMMNVVPIHAANPGPMTGAGNWTYWFGGDAPVLIDAGVGRAEHIETIRGLRPSGPARVIVSHAHPDHASGAPALAAQWPGASFFKHPWTGRDPQGVAWQALADGDRIETAEGELEVLRTPGHSPDHLVFWHAASRTLFGADLLQRGTTVVIPASSGGDLADYLASLRRVLALTPARVYPAHGPVIEDPAALINQYLAHRLSRETQILSALESGRHTVEAIADRIYVGLMPALVPMARESVLAHLVKLEKEGVLRREGQQWLTR